MDSLLSVRKKRYKAKGDPQVRRAIIGALSRGAGPTKHVAMDKALEPCREAD